MEYYDVVNKRRTIREFSDREIPGDKIKRILEAGLKAPTYNHLREWDYILVKDNFIRLEIIKAEDISDTFDLNGLKEEFAKYNVVAVDMYLDAIPKQKSMLLKAPELLAVVYRPKTDVKESQRIYDLNCLASVWCCIENILLALTEEELYGVTYIPHNTERIKDILAIPQSLEVAALIPFGYKAENAREPKQKPVCLDEKLHFNRW